MTKRWRKALLTAAISIAVGGIAVACTGEDDPGLSGPSTDEVVGRPQLADGALLSNSCTHNINPTYSAEVTGNCVEIFGNSLTLYVSPPPATNAEVTFDCDAWGTPPYPFDQIGNAQAYNPVISNFPYGSGWRHFFFYAPGGSPGQSSVPFISRTTADTVNFKVKYRPTHPTNPGIPEGFGCTIDQGSRSIALTIIGTVPVAVKSIDALSGPSTIGVGQSVTYGVSTYTDNYEYVNALVPAPTFTWSTTSGTGSATVTPGTNIVTGTTVGTVTVKATNNGKTKTKSVIVGTCAGVSLNTASPVNLLYNHAAINVTATPTGCTSGMTPSAQPITWSAVTQGIVGVGSSGPAGQTGTLTPNGNGGTTTVKACLPYPAANPICGQLTVNLAKLQITNYYDGSTATIPLSTSGTMTWDVRNVGVGAYPFGMSCFATGQISCVSGTSPQNGNLGTNQSLVVSGFYTTSASGGSATLKLGADGMYNVVNINVSNTSGDPLALYLDDYPNPVKAYATCTWNTSVSGGTTPYTFSWTIDGNPISAIGGSLEYPNSGNPFVIGVTVTDALGATAYDETSIGIFTSGPGSCLF